MKGVIFITEYSYVRQKFSLDESGLPKGVYLVTIQSGSGMECKKLVIQ